MTVLERLDSRWSRATAAARSTVQSSDGAALHANPNFVNAVLSVLIAGIFLSVILDSSLRRLFVGEARDRIRSAPRRIGRIVRKIKTKTGKAARAVRPRPQLRSQPLIQSFRGRLGLGLGRLREGRLGRLGRQLAGGRRGSTTDFAIARTELEATLATMVGLANIKAHLTGLLDTFEMDERRAISNPAFVPQRGCMHMVFLGNPGTGKTAVAQLVASLLKELGLLCRGQLVVAKKADMLGRYSNHVARNTRSIVASAVGGVLLIDEAYSLVQGEAELGREAINVLVDLCYVHKDEMVVILAGYEDSMNQLFSANAGLASRFPHKVCVT